MATQDTSNPERLGAVQISLLGALSLGLLWAYWPTLAAMARVWGSNPQYSHGYLVPAFALVLLWLRRPLLTSASLTPSWWGLPLIAVAVLLRLAGAFIYFDWFEYLSLLPLLAGICLLVGGRGTFRWVWPAVGFLVFMLPLPFRLEVALAQPLRRIATASSTFALQTLGLPAVAEGNIIRINEIQIGVVEACSGLSMLLVFFALSSAVALLIRRPPWERLVVLFSAIPIAVIANVVRITATGFLHVYLGQEAADRFFHDFAGWMMMPLALGILWLELQGMRRLFIEPDSDPHPAQTQHDQQSGTDRAVQAGTVPVGDG